jgi:hypothetical protein
MDWLEQELKSALERKPPSHGFAERVSAAAARPRARVMAWPRWVPAAAAVALLLSGGYGYREYQGRLAKERVLLAMKIVSGKLNHMQAHVREVSR